MISCKLLSFGAVFVAHAAIVTFFGIQHFMESSVSVDVIKYEIQNLIDWNEFSEGGENLYVEKIMRENKTDVSPEATYLILKKFWIELNSRNDIDLIQLMGIYKTLQSKVINNENSNDTLKLLANEICEKEIRPKIQKESAIRLKVILLKNADEDHDAEDLLNSLFRTSEEIFDDVNKLVIDEIYEIITPYELLQKFNRPYYRFPRKVFSILHLLSKSATIQQIFLVDFWISYSLITEELEYERKNNLTVFTENKFSQLLDYFPSDVKTLLLSQKVTLRNYVSEKYISRLSSPRDHDIELYYYKTSRSSWHIYYALDNIFYIQDGINNKRYMYISETEKVHRVHVGNSSEYGKWRFYKKDNSFSIFSLDSGYFLCSNSNNQGAVSLMQNDDQKECRWLVESF